MHTGEGILRFLTCGSVDDGKSTLIGHLLHTTGNIPDDQFLTLERESRRIGTAGERLDYSLLMDGLMAEREQGITIDVAYRYFETASRKYIVADTPGHESYTRNMATGASTCSAAMILVDARTGVLPQTRRHLLICAQMGIGEVLFVVNKMDLVGWNESCFREIERECIGIAGEASRLSGIECRVEGVPVSALLGDNLSERSTAMPWYVGPTVLKWLEAVPASPGRMDAPFRMPVQLVLKGTAAQQSGSMRHDSDAARSVWRSYAGPVVSGQVRRGEEVVMLPSGWQTRIERLLVGNRDVESATAGASVSVVLAGEHDVARGDCIATMAERPEQDDLFKVRMVWMDSTPMFAGRRYLFRSVFGTTGSTLTRIRSRISLDSWEQLAADRLEVNDVGEAELSLDRRMPFDPYGSNHETGSFILIDRLSNATVACGMIQHAMRRSKNLHLHPEGLSRNERAGMKGQSPCVIWFTGLSGSGKSSIANCLESMLYEAGLHTMVLDGDNIRHGLNRDLGFTEADRVENIRRIGEVVRLMADAGLIVITAFISPFRVDREMVRSRFSEGEFIEVHLSTSLEICASRDPKGLYKKARSGAIPNFTGINAPYEEPENPEIRLDTAIQSIEACASVIIKVLQEKGCIPFQER